MSATMRLMMQRTALHIVGTLFALYVSLSLWTGNELWTRVTLYAFAWALCAGVYFALLYLWDHVLEAFDNRVRAVVRDERTVDEMRRYQRRLRFISRWHRAKAMDRRDGP